MVQIIETNLSMKDNQVVDHQSRVVEAESWKDYILYYKENIEQDRRHSNFKSLTAMWGDSLPRYGEVSELKYDEFHLSCYHTNFNGFVTMHLAYLCEISHNGIFAVVDEDGFPIT